MLVCAVKFWNPHLSINFTHLTHRSDTVLYTVVGQWLQTAGTNGAMFRPSGVWWRMTNRWVHCFVFGRLFVKRFALWYLTVVLSVTLSVCPVCDVGALWPNGWMDQDETWQAGRPLPGHIVLDGDPPLPPQRGTAPQFSAHVCCGQMAGWIKMPLGMEVGLSLGDIVLDGDPAPPRKKAQPRPIFGPCRLWPNGWMD